MSYDVTLVEKATDGTDRELFYANHTSNTAQMWRDAGVNLKDFNGAPAATMVQPVRAAAHQIAIRPADFVHHVPRRRDGVTPSIMNGTVESTVRFLLDIADACEAHPTATVEVTA